MFLHIRRLRLWIRSAYRVESQVGHIALSVVAILIIIATFGIVANQLVIVANNGKMPVFFEHPEELRMDDRHCVATEDTVLPLLADYIYIDGLNVERDSLLVQFLEKTVSLPLHLDRIESPGDVMMRFGFLLGFAILAVLVPFAFWRYRRQRRNK